MKTQTNEKERQNLFVVWEIADSPRNIQILLNQCTLNLISRFHFIILIQSVGNIFVNYIHKKGLRQKFNKKSFPLSLSRSPLRVPFEPQSTFLLCNLLHINMEKLKKKINPRGAKLN